MVSTTSFSLILFFVINVFIDPITCMLPIFLKNDKPVHISSLQQEFSSIIDKIKIIDQLRCPKGWMHLGGSCYHLSKNTSIPTVVNHTCNNLLRSHPMQIRHTIELFYAVHLLTKYNLSRLMIEINTDLEKRITKILTNDQSQWQRIIDNFRRDRIEYNKLRKNLLDKLNSSNLCILKCSNKIKQSSRNPYGYYNEHQMANSNCFDYIEDKTNGFEKMEDIRTICDRIDWKIRNTNSTIYELTTVVASNETICSLSNVQSNREYEHICEYVLDYCFANDECGTHGHCVNTLTGFQCSCSLLYTDLRCDKISFQGKQIIVGIILALILYLFSLKPIRWILIYVKNNIHLVFRYYKYRKSRRKMHRSKKPETTENFELKQKAREDDESVQLQQLNTDESRSATAPQTMKTIFPKREQMQNPRKLNRIRLIWIGGLTTIFSSLLFSITTIVHMSLFQFNTNSNTDKDLLINNTAELLTQCGNISNYRKENFVFFPMALVLIFIFSWSKKRQKGCQHQCDIQPDLIAPIEPFRTENRFTTATVFGILALEVLKLSEELVFNSQSLFNRHVLIELFDGIVIVLLIGFRYYPVLASLQLRNIIARFFVCLYILANVFVTIVREGLCMGFLSLSRYYPPVEEAKLRIKLGPWFLIFGLFKNIPHFILLAYITAELCVRFAYDSIYLPIKKGQSIWITSAVKSDEFAFAKFYVAKLFRQSVRLTKLYYRNDINIDRLEDLEHAAELRRNANPNLIKKFFYWISYPNDGFRFTTIATCTYTVAIVFLYYLVCTLVFLYISIGRDLILSLKKYIEITHDIEFQEYFSLRSMMIISAVLTFVIFAFQLVFGILNYKRHKLQLFKGIREEIPSIENFQLNSILLESLHYSGYLVSYMAWGFVICFNLILFILITTQVLLTKKRYTYTTVEITVPLLVIYILRQTILSTAGFVLFIRNMEERLHLKNSKMYAILVYFNFFADCYLGIALSFIRLIKAGVLHVIYMARVDCSFFGRSLETCDSGFSAYVSYLHMEVAHTNPIMLAFCYSLYDDMIKQRSKQCCDNECCIARCGLDTTDDNSIIETSVAAYNKQISKPKKTKEIQLKTKPDQDDDSISPSLSEQSPQSKSDDVIGKISPTHSNDYREIEEENRYNTISINEERSAEAIHSSLKSVSSSSSNYSKTNGNKHSSEQILKEEQQTNQSIAKIDQKEQREEEDDDDEEEEEEVEEEEETKKPKYKSSKTKLKPVLCTRTAHSSTSNLTEPEGELHSEKVTRQKRARFRWFLAYTMLNNYCLFDLRKYAQFRLNQLDIVRNEMIRKQQHERTTVVQQFDADSIISESPERIQRKLKIAKSAPEISLLSEERRPIISYRLPISTPDDDDCNHETSISTISSAEWPQSLAERYVTFRSYALSDFNAKQISIPHSPLVRRIQSISTQHARIETKSNLSSESSDSQP